MAKVEAMADLLVMGTHTIACMMCLIGAKKVIDRYVDIPGMCGSVTKMAGALWLGTMLSSNLPFERMARKILKKYKAMKKEEKHGRETDTGADDINELDD